MSMVDDHSDDSPFSPRRDEDITSLLWAWQAGDKSALDVKSQ